MSDRQEKRAREEEERPTLVELAKLIANLDTDMFHSVMRHAAVEVTTGGNGVAPKSDLYYLLRLTADYHRRIHSPETGANRAEFINNATDDELALLVCDLQAFRQQLENLK
jgi:hypothetical protein